MRKLLLFALLLGCAFQPALARQTPVTPALLTTLVTPPKTVAPVKTVTRPKPAPITLRVFNPSDTAHFNNIILEWALQVNGTILQKGKSAILRIGPNQSTLIHLTLQLPDDKDNEHDETFLQLRYRSQPTLLTRSIHPAAARPAPSIKPASPLPGPILAEQQLLLRPVTGPLQVIPAGELTPSDLNDTFTIRSPDIYLAFHKQKGWLIHYEVKGVLLLADTFGLKPNFWWPGYNDSANKNPDSGWLTATRNPRLQLFSTTIGADLIIIRTEYTLPATSCVLHLSYTINATGEMLVTQQVEPDTTQPAIKGWPLPCFGMQWILPPGYDSITYYGPGNPGWTGLYREQPVTPSPVMATPSPRTGIRWWKITGRDGSGLQITADSSLLDFSAIHAFDSDATPTTTPQPVRPQTQLSIDIHNPNPANHPWPIIVPYGNYKYSYKVIPLSPTHP